MDTARNSPPSPRLRKAASVATVVLAAAIATGAPASAATVHGAGDHSPRPAAQAGLGGRSDATGRRDTSTTKGVPTRPGSGAPAASPGTRDEEQRGVIIPDQRPLPHHDSEDEHPATAQRIPVTPEHATPPIRSVARPALPETGGNVALLLSCGVLLLVAGAGVRYATD